MKHRWNCSSKKCHWMNLNNKENTDHPNTNVNLFTTFFFFDISSKLNVCPGVLLQNVWNDWTRKIFISSFWCSFRLDSFLFFLLVCFHFKTSASSKWAIIHYWGNGLVLKDEHIWSWRKMNPQMQWIHTSFFNATRGLIKKDI